MHVEAQVAAVQISTKETPLKTAHEDEMALVVSPQGNGLPAAL